jgi:hypothetical protein
MSEKNKKDLELEKKSINKNDINTSSDIKDAQKKRQKKLAKERKAKREKEKEKEELNAKKRDYSGKSFDPEDLFYDYFKPKGLSTAAMESLIHHGGTEKMTSDEEYTGSVKAFFDYSMEVQDKNIEFDPNFIRSLNQKNLLHLGVLGDGNMPNKILDEGARKKMAFEVFDKMFLSRRVDHEALIDVLSIHTGIDNSKDKHSEQTLALLNEYMDLPHRENILLKKLDALKNNGSLNDSNYKKGKIASILLSKEFLSAKAMDYSADDIDDIGSEKIKDSLRDINKTITFDKGVGNKSQRGLSITENNDNLFLDKKIEFRDQDFYKRIFEKEIQSSDNLSMVSSKEKINSYWDNIKPWGGKSKKLGEPFKITIVQTDKNGNSQGMINISRVSKSIVVDTMPESQDVYRLMAVAAKMKGIKKPRINCFEKDPKDREKFVMETMSELIKLDYDIKDIRIPKDMEYLRDQFNTIKQGIDEVEELENEADLTKNNQQQEQVEPTNNNNQEAQLNGDGNADEPEDQQPFDYSTSGDDIVNEGNLNTSQPHIFNQQPLATSNEHENIRHDDLTEQPENKDLDTLFDIYKGNDVNSSASNDLVGKLKGNNNITVQAIEGIDPEKSMIDTLAFVKMTNVVKNIIEVSESINPEIMSENFPGLRGSIDALKGVNLNKKNDVISMEGAIKNAVKKLDIDITSPLKEEDLKGTMLIIPPQKTRVSSGTPKFKN